MRIEAVEVSNFRRLRAVRVELAPERTLLVGANNSGKTSAMVALDLFLRQRGGLSINDFSAWHWGAVNTIGDRWLANQTQAPTLAEWVKVLPALDLWLRVEDGEFHRVSRVIPTLDWAGGLLGVRLRYEPKDVVDLQKKFLERSQKVRALREEAEGTKSPPPTRVWPKSMIAFLERRLDGLFAIKTYLLDPSRYLPPRHGVAQPQELRADALPVDGDPLRGLVKVHMVGAQRGLGDAERGDGDDRAKSAASPRRLSTQLRAYYAKHLDPESSPEKEDLEALRAIERAEDAFGRQLKQAFEKPLSQVRRLGYPGVSDPQVSVSTRIRPMDSLAHEAAVGYHLGGGGNEGPPLVLPETYNGLGYQNLISMVFRLMAFRDSWMRVGKAALGDEQPRSEIEPIHLVLVEEPEAHLHAQVQQVFIRKAYQVLQDADDLGDSSPFTTQLVVSTHSSHVAHAVDYADLRYFRREPRKTEEPIPASTVVNLREVFGAEDETARFVTRYLKTSHSDLLFADAAIFIEGAAERILVPHFVERAEDGFLGTCYVTILEIGGSHAFRLRPLVEALGITTLLVTDLDAQEPSSRKRRPPARDANFVTSNSTLKTWVPGLSAIDDLVDAGPEQRCIGGSDEVPAPVYVVYPSEGNYTSAQGVSETLIPYTFEDALVLENLSLMQELGSEAGTYLRKIVKVVAGESQDLGKLAEQLFAVVKEIKKAELALDVLQVANDAQFKRLVPPRYIDEGLTWLAGQLRDLRTRTLGARRVAGDEE